MRTLYELGELRLDPEARVLTHSGTPVTLGARAVAVLAALVGRANEYVPKAEIMDAAWPGLVVEEANLAVQISAIRRALAQVAGGEGWIETLARRGYRFVGPVAVIAGRAGETPTPFDRKRTNLPQVLTSFVGREREIAEIKRLLPATRLLTLTGTGGIGKTRLALQAAAEILDAYCDGIWFVDLAPLTDPLLVPSAVAQVLGVKEATGEALTHTLCAHLRAKEMLLVLDNCEHLLGASADLADALLRDTAKITVITTSREPLRVATEQTYRVSALPLPDPKAEAKAIARSDAVQLFLDRARQHRPRFDLEESRAHAVAEICVRLDGIPLALELAAVRVGVLPVEEILRLLDQRFRLLTRGGGELRRQQTLRAMIDWSYELLDHAERQLFARLAVFAGGWTVAAAKFVGAGEAITDDDVVYLLIALIEKSLVLVDEDGDRYRMLETLREYAHEKLLKDGGAEAVQRRHCDHFVALAEEAHENFASAEQSEWLQRLDQEHDNLRAVLQWSLGNAGDEKGALLCGKLGWFWYRRGYYTEGREWCERILDSPGAELRARPRANVLQAAGLLGSMQGEYASAHAWHLESLAIRRELGDRRGVANSLNNLGIVAYFQSDYVAARAWYEESLEIARELDDCANIAALLGNLGNIARAQNDLAAAAKYLEDSLTIMRKMGDQSGIAAALCELGHVAFLDRRDFPSARKLIEEGISIGRAVGEKRIISTALRILGDLTCEEGDLSGATSLMQESLVIRRGLGDIQGQADSLDGLAAVVAALGKSDRAAQIWAVAERLREEIGSPLPSSERASYSRRVDMARARLDDDAAFACAWAEGRRMPLEQAIELALGKTVEQ